MQSDAWYVIRGTWCNLQELVEPPLVRVALRGLKM
jgi:hypothetical protein